MTGCRGAQRERFLSRLLLGSSVGEPAGLPHSSGRGGGGGSTKQPYHPPDLLHDAWLNLRKVTWNSEVALLEHLGMTPEASKGNEGRLERFLIALGSGHHSHSSWPGTEKKHCRQEVTLPGLWCWKHDQP